MQEEITVEMKQTRVDEAETKESKMEKKQPSHEAEGCSLITATLPSWGAGASD